MMSVRKSKPAAGSQALPGKPTASEALPPEAEPLAQCVPRQSLGTRNFCTVSASLAGVRSMIRLPGIGMIGLVLVLSSTGDLSAQANAAKADFVLINGKIWTVNKAQPEA